MAAWSSDLAAIFLSYAFFIARLGQYTNMTKMTALGVLLGAAVLEAGGDALVRWGLHQNSGLTRGAAFALGAAILFAYGYSVNAPDWDFGRLLGIYVVFFFVIAQLMSWLFFHQPPGRATLVGGALIVAGGLVMGVANY